MAPARFRTNPQPFKKKAATREKRLHRLEASGIVSLWKEGLDSCEQDIIIEVGKQSREWNLWQYRDTLRDDYPTS